MDCAASVAVTALGQCLLTAILGADFRSVVPQDPADRGEDDAARLPVALKVSGGTLKRPGVVLVTIHGH